ncbi:MAG TPA: type II secretion system protein [Rhizomicrobium sp.]
MAFFPTRPKRKTRRREIRTRRHAPDRASPDNGDGGFTLLEVLVALAILGMSLAVLLGVFSQALNRTRENQRRADAYSLAQTLLLQTETALPSTLKDRTGASGSGLHWTVRFQDYGGAQDRANWQQRAVRISTLVRWDDHGRDRSASLSTLRLLPKAAGQ